jgi:hypothetical protein
MFAEGDLPMRTIATVFGLLFVAMALAASAFAAEITREEYKTAAEPICTASTKANERILSNVRKEVSQGKLKRPAAQFAKAAQVQAGALKELKALPRPSADEARLTAWFSALGTEVELFATAGRKLRAGDGAGASHIINKLSQNANEANLQVLPFGFHYCRQETSKFT